MAITGSKFSALTAQQKADTRDAIRGYKIYLAKLTQTGTGDPTATIIENTLGTELTFIRNNIGDFTAVIYGDKFGTDNNKFICQCQITSINGTPDSVIIGGISMSYIGGMYSIGLRTANYEFSYRDNFTAIIEIKIYP